MKKYDYIVFGANINGLTTALYLKKKGASVLLLNYYGFPGGSVSESLNCVQRIPVEPGTIAEMIFRRIDEDENGVQGREGQSVFLNPETVKYTFQQVLIESNIDILFHVNPVSFSNGEKEIKQLTLFAREGYINCNADKFIDCTDSYSMYSLLPEVQKEISGLFLNVIISGLKPESEGIIAELSTRKFILKENRIWFNFQIQKTDAINIESTAQSKINAISAELMKYSSRIQMVPAQTQVRYKLINTSSTPDVFHSDLIINHDYFLDEEFIKAGQLEHCLNDKGI